MPSAVARALPLYPGRRISGHQHRANRVALAAGAATAATWWWSAITPGDLPVSRRFVRQLHDFSGPVCRVPARRPRCAPLLHAAAGRQLPFVRAHPARRGPSHRHNEKPLIPKKALVPHKQDGEKVRIAVRIGGRRGPVDGKGNRATASRREPMAQSFAVLYRGHAHRDKLVEVLKSADSLRHPESFDSFPPLVRDLIAYLRLLDKPSTTWPARACWRCRPGASNRPIWCGSANAPRRAKGIAVGHDASGARRTAVCGGEAQRRTDEMVAGLDAKNGVANGVSRPSNYSTN